MTGGQEPKMVEGEGNKRLSGNSNAGTGCQETALLGLDVKKLLSGIIS